MNSLRWLLYAALAGSLSAGAAELGRQDVKQSDLPITASGYNVPVAKSYQGQAIGTGLGIEVGLDWTMLWWSMDKSFSDQTFAPELSLLYGVGDNWDIRLTGKYMAARDDKDGSNGDTDFYRVGVGSRAWFHAGGDWYPFVSLGLNYYMINVKDGSNEKGMPGVSAQAGIAYMLSDWAMVHLALQGETSFLQGSVDINNKSQNFRVAGTGLSLGLSLVF